MTTFLVRLPRPIDCRADRFRALVRRAAKAKRRDPSVTLAKLAFRCDERAFAVTLLERATQMWIYRTDQTGGCGDFVVVDMSSPDPARRPIYAVELKLGQALGRSAGLQLRHADIAAAELARAGITRAPIERLMGSRLNVLAHLGV